MRKLFLLLPALVLSLFTNAAVININTGTADALRKALNSASDGDIIEMAAGTYVESNENFIAFTGKHVTVRAAEGAEVIIQPQVPITVSEGGCAHFQNVKIDASHLNDIQSWYEHIIYATDAAANNRIILEGCEIYGFALNKSLISCSSSNTLDALTINNCYFHNINKSCVFIENTSNSIAISITNSTFANITTDAGSYYAGVIDTRATSGSFLVDHCTFYNVEAMSTGYAAIGQIKLTSGATVSNCIFALSASGAATNRTIRDKVTATNCLVYNYTTDSNYGMQSDVTKTGCFIANPLFTDAANGNFSLAGNWVSMNISPARGAATDGSDLGDPRWYTAETLPSTDFASPYAFVGEKAIVSNNMEKDANNYIHSKSSGGLAVWKIHSTRACDVEVTLNMDPDGTVIGHNYQVEIFDADGNSIGSLDEGGWHNNVDDKVLSNKIHFPAEGDYKIELTNSISGSTSTIKGITLTFAGGAVFDLPTTLLPIDAAISQYAEINGDNELVFSTKDWLVLEQYGKWNIHVEKSGNYEFQLNAKSTNSHSYKVSILTANESETLQYFEKSGSYGEDLSASEVLTLTPGDYVVMVQNTTNYSAGRLVNIVITYEGGALVNLPNAAIPFEDAILNGATRDGEGIHFGMADRYAQWNVAATAGLYSFTFNIVGSDYGKYQLTIIDSESNTIYDDYKALSNSGSVTHSSIYLDGNYTLRVANTNNHSVGYITSISATAEENVFIMDENTTDDGSIAAAAAAGISYKFLLKRSFTAGRYYTICIPVGSWNDELKLAFGADYELWKMSSATQSGDEISLNFEQCNTESFHAGWPYLIKPSIDVENPIFYNKKTIQNSTYNNTQSFAAADFIGSFYKTVIPAGESNLYLQNNNLYYSETNNTPIKGTRAWIQLNQSGSLAPARARIVLQNQVVTDIQLANPEDNKAVKTIENGQLIIIRDGVRYNAMGIIMK